MNTPDIPDAPVGNDEEFIRPALRARIHQFGGIVLGRSREGGVQLTEHFDVQFRNLYAGMRFLEYVNPGDARLREPVSDLGEQVTFRLLVLGSFDENRTPGQ